LVEEKETKIEENTKKVIEKTKKVQESTSSLTKVTHINTKQKQIKQYATCQRLLVEEPTFFDTSSICSTSSVSVTTTSSSSGGLSSSSQTCQMCYAQNPSCAGNSGTSSGISVVSFSADSQGEADDFVQRMFDENMIADVNFLSAMVSRKFAINGAVTSEPSQVRVELVTSDNKVDSLVSRISTWKNSAGKQNGGAGNDAIVTPLSGGSSDYITFVMRQTQAQPTLRVAPSPVQMMAQQSQYNLVEDKY